MKFKKIMNKTIILVLVCIFLSSCKPHIECVRFYEYSVRYPNRLEIIINTKKDLFKGRESFLSFKRDVFTFYSKVRNNEFTEKDLYMSVWNEKKMKYDSLNLKSVNIKILKKDSISMKVEVQINDNMIPKMANGIFNLNLKDHDLTGYKMYEFKK
jgi:hypothetical protein